MACGQCAVFLLQARNAQHRFHQRPALLQRGAGSGVEGAGLQRIKREHAPGLAVDAQAHAHAVVHRQGLAHQGVEQAVVGVGQLAVVVKAGDLAAGQDRCQARVLADSKPPPQRFAHQPVHGHGAQVVLFKAQQGDGAAAKLRAQPAHQALQAHGLRLLGHQVGENGFDSQGIYHHKQVF